MGYAGVALGARADLKRQDPNSTPSEQGKEPPMTNSGDNAEQLSVGEAADIDTLGVGTSPSYSQAVLDAVLAQALGMAMYNAVTAQQNASAARSAAVLMACSAMLSLPVSNITEPAAQADVGAAPADK